MAADQNNDDDLYGDLDGTVAIPTTLSTKRQRFSTNETPTATDAPNSTSPYNSNATTSSKSALLVPQSELHQLQQQINTLRAENEVLKKNMGILYRTAKSELDRKDRTIDRLQNELDGQRM